jgi:hypothetical protein
MQETPTGLLLAGVIFLILLFIVIFAAVIVYFRQNQSQEPEEDEGKPQAQPRSQATQQPSAQTTDAPERVPSVEAPDRPGEVMRVIRDQQTGRMLVEVDGKQYTHIREIADAQVGRRVLWAISDLVRFTGGMATNPQAMRNIAQEEPKGSPDVASISSVPTASTVTRSAPDHRAAPPVPQTRLAEAVSLPAALARPRPATETSAPPAEAKPRQRYSLLGYFRQGFTRGGSTAPAASPTSFINEIEAILQGSIQRLAAPPSSEVHVLTGENGALQIEVGNAVYGSPDEVPDPQIRQMIKDAVAEWEKS